MAWPVDSRFEVTHEAAPINLSSRRKRQKIFHEPWNSPTLSTKLWGAATLSQTKDGLQWSYAAESNTGKILLTISATPRLISLEATKLNAPLAPRKLYPESRPPSVEGSTLSKPRLAEQGVSHGRNDVFRPEMLRRASIHLGPFSPHIPPRRRYPVRAFTVGVEPHIGHTSIGS